MRFSHIGIIAVMLVVIAVAFAGCSGSSPTAPSGGGAQQAGTPASGSSGGQAAAVSGTDLFGGLKYDWVEYKMTAGSGSEAMTIYSKYYKTGKCTYRMEGPAVAQLPESMRGEQDCTSQPGQASASNPNELESDAKVDCSLIPETVTVPAGTFSATKCTVTSKESTGTMWVDKGKFMVKMEGSAGGGTMNLVLNDYSPK